MGKADSTSFSTCQEKNENRLPEARELRPAVFRWTPGGTECAKVDSVAAGFYRTLIRVKAVWPE
jgi:hypothetical protein